MERFNDPRKRAVTGASTLFRNKKLLEHIQNTILPDVLSYSNRFHVWCAGCSVGMETYSIGMVTLDWLTRRGSQDIARFLGSDISPDAIATAVSGVYALTRQSIQGYEKLLERYTVMTAKNSIRMSDELRKRTTFIQRDIREGSRRHRFELIVCDHVLQYFPETEQFDFIDAMVRALQPSGYLFVSTPARRVHTILPVRYNLSVIDRHLYKHKG